MRKSLALAVATTSLAGVGALAPAAANAADTNVTFTLAGGSLTLDAPTSAALAASPVSLAVGGTSVSGTLGSTTVTDNRGALAHLVTVNMKSTAFTDAASDTIAATNVTGYSGVATVSGAGTAAPTATGQALAGTGSTILTIAGVIGSTQTTYNPTVSVSIPGTAIQGDYSGTVTQTVS